MSYILEALRKADAERERGTVPDLHAQMRPLGAPPAPAMPSALRGTWWWAAGGVLLMALAGAAWYLLGRSEPVRMVAATPPAEAAAPMSNVAPPVPAPPASAAAASAPIAAAAPASTAAKVEPAPAPPRKPKRVVRAKPKPATPARTAEVPTAPPAVDPAALRVPPLAELPGELRQQVPAMVIGGSVYSPQASARMVIVNGQVFHEGSNLAPELKLEQIRPKRAVFSIRGTLFEMPL